MHSTPGRLTLQLPDGQGSVARERVDVQIRNEKIPLTGQEARPGARIEDRAHDQRHCEHEQRKNLSPRHQRTPTILGHSATESCT